MKLLFLGIFTQSSSLELQRQTWRQFTGWSCLAKRVRKRFCQKNSDSTLWQVQSSDRNSWGWCNKVVLCINVYNDLSLSIDRECQCPSLQGELSKILFITSHLACEIMMPDRLTVQNCSTWNVQKGMISLAARLGLLIGFNLIIICMSNCWRFKLPYSWRSLEWSFAECQHVLWWSEVRAAATEALELDLWYWGPCPPVKLAR